METRICKKCNQEQEITQFEPNKECKSGRVFTCRTCRGKRRTELLVERNPLLKAPSLEGEFWVDISKYEELYSVSNFGRVKSKERLVRVQKEHKRIVRECILVICQLPHDYCYVKLFKNNEGEMKYIHRLVGEAFLENPNNLPEINHKDFDPTNNNLLNLEWSTHRNNVEYSIHNLKRGESHYKSNLTESQVLEIRSTKGLLQREIGDKFGLKQSTIHSILRRKSWKHI